MKLQGRQQSVVSLMLSAMLFALCFSAEAQQTAKVVRMGFLDNSTASGSAVQLKAFWQEIRNLGWIERKNIVIDYRFADQDTKRLPELAAELVRLKPDVIVVVATSSALAVKSATTTIPIVLTGVGDPVAAGLIASLARPEGNVTGLSSLTPELGSKRLEVLKDTIPGLSRVGVIHPPEGSAAQNRQLQELRAAALALQLKLEEIETRFNAEAMEKAFQAAKQKQVGAIMTLTGPRFFSERKRIVELAGKYRLPAIYSRKEYLDEGGLMFYGVDYNEFYRAAVYVDKILKGAKPADLPVEQPTKFELLINLKTAKQIGLNIPPNVLARADGVIK
jgi:putative ABC transport system substrate-binding protein